MNDTVGRITFGNSSGPRVAHSMSEYNRLRTQGSPVALPAFKEIELLKAELAFAVSLMTPEQLRAFDTEQQRRRQAIQQPVPSSPSARPEARCLDCRAPYHWGPCEAPTRPWLDNLDDPTPQSVAPESSRAALAQQVRATIAQYDELMKAFGNRARTSDMRVCIETLRALLDPPAETQA